MKPKHQRMWLAGLAVLAVAGASGLALSALKDQAAFFYTPTDLAKAQVPPGKFIRIGGLVMTSSVAKLPDGVTTRFIVTDNQRMIGVLYRGILPDLFREGSGVVAEGRMGENGAFIADTILAKHDEKYQPPELAGKLHETKSLKQ